MAMGGHTQVPPDWMPAAQVRPFIFEDPAVVWLEYHGAQHGFQPDTSAYEFADFIGEKARQFEEKWVHEMASEAVHVCAEPREVRLARTVEKTFELMQQGRHVIAQPALWWAPERIYGVPDLLIHTSWLRERFPGLIGEAESQVPATGLGEGGRNGHYVVFDCKFTTKLDQSRKAQDLENYAAQVRIYSYMLGQLQGLMPGRAFLVARDRIRDPLPVDISSRFGGPLDDDLAAMRDQFIEIKVNGARYLPWQDEIVAANMGGGDDRWRSAKGVIAREKTPGGDARLLYNIGTSAQRQLADMGYANLAAMLEKDPGAIPFEDCKGIGGKKATQIRAVLQANRSQSPVFPPADLVPPRRPFEFYVDFEYFTNVNVDFETQWPTLDGYEIVFMVGVGWEEQGHWRFDAFVAEAEEQMEELTMFEAFIAYLDEKIGGATFDDATTAVFHWTSAEVWQSRRVADRHELPAEHALRKLPWVDLQKAFLNGPAAVPGAWAFSLKEVAKAIGQVDPALAHQWPGDLGEGLRAMVMGWKAYQAPHPAASEEMKTLKQYLEADCKALWQILRWLRASSL
jgi:uncharacterized protein